MHVRSRRTSGKGGTGNGMGRGRTKGKMIDDEQRKGRGRCVVNTIWCFTVADRRGPRRVDDEPRAGYKYGIPPNPPISSPPKTVR